MATYMIPLVIHGMKIAVAAIIFYVGHSFAISNSPLENIFTKFTAQQ